MSLLSATPAVDTAAELDRLLRTGAVHAAYQPVVDLLDGSIVAYEALACVHGDSPLAAPPALFAAARASGRPAPLPRLRVAQPTFPVAPAMAPRPLDRRTPFALAQASGAPRHVATKDQLLATSV